MPKARTLPTMGQPQPGRPIAPAQAATQADGPRALVGALTLPIEQLTPDPNQPRRAIDSAESDAGLRELAASLTEYGVLQPLLVREQGTLDDGRTRYMIVAGGRRYAAALLAGLTRLPAVVRESEGATLRRTQLIENIQRRSLAPLDEARAFQEIIDDEGITASKVAERLHISDQTVRDRLLLLSDQPIADAVQRGQIGPTVARDILRTADEPQAILRELVDAGEVVTKATVKDVRDRATTSGVKNARAKGGGRRKPQGTMKAVLSADLPPDLPPTKDHNGYDPASAELAQDDLESALVGIDRTAVVRLLSFGSTRQWTCQQLLDAINEPSLHAKT